MFHSSSVETDAIVRVKIFPGGRSSVLHWQGTEKEFMTFGSCKVGQDNLTR